MSVTNTQIQTFLDQRVRTSSAAIVLWVLQRQSDVANIDEIYANLAGSPDWVDSNGSASVHSAAPSDVLAWNTFVSKLVSIITGAATNAATTLADVQSLQGQWPIIKKLPTIQVP